MVKLFEAFIPLGFCLGVIVIFILILANWLDLRERRRRDEQFKKYLRDLREASKK